MSGRPVPAACRRNFPLARRSRYSTIRLVRESVLHLQSRKLVARPSGALWWPAERLLAFADLHFEKGSSFALRGQLLPPYDTRETLSRMAAEIARFDPATVVCLGDSFHDLGGWARMHAGDAGLVAALAAGRRWVWIAGNHDAELPRSLPGETAAHFERRGLVFRHRAESERAAPEVSGHYHPKIAVRARGKVLVRPCFLEDGTRLILPAFGAYAGGLDANDEALRPIFPRGYIAHVLGGRGVYCMAAAGSCPDG
jgi:hypothetical protein